jgi:CRP-like cAMP-binding protein
MYNILERCVLFKGLKSNDIKILFSDIFFQVKEFESNSLISYQDEPVEFLMIIIEGKVKGEMIDFSGKAIVIEEIESPRPLAPAFLFGENSIFPVNIVAQEHTKILKIQKFEFIKLMQKNNTLLTNFMNIISDRAQFLSQKLKFLSFHSIKGKLAYYILDISKNYGSSNITLPITQSKLADLFGVTRPSLGRAIRELHNDGLVISNGKNIEILDYKELNKLIK